MYDENGIKVDRWWNLEDEMYKNVFKCLDEKIEELVTLFYDSVKLRTRSDVPIASFLSGGVDLVWLLHPPKIYKL